MADNTATWIIRIIDDASGATDDATAALKQLEEQLKASTAELAGMQKALRNLQAAANPNAAAIDDLKKKIESQKDVVAKVQQQHIAMGGSFISAGKGSKSLEARLAALQKQGKDIPGPLGAIMKALGSLKGLVGSGVISGGMVAIAAGIVAITGAVLAGTAALYNYGIAQADAARSEALHLTSLNALKGASGGDELSDMIDDVAEQSPLARAEIVKMAEGLKGMKLTAEQARAKLEGLAIPDDAEDQLISLTVATEKQKEAFNALFKGLEITGFLKAWKSVSDLMNQSTASGRALKQMLSIVLQPLIDASADAATALKKFFQGMIIAALRFMNWLIKVRILWRQTFGSPEQKKGVDDLTKWVTIGKVALGLLVGALVIAGFAFVKLSISITAYLVPALGRLALGWLRVGISAAGAILPFLPFILAAIGLGAAIYMLVTRWDDLKTAFEQLDWAQAGEDIISGIISGLLPGPLIDAMMNLGSSAYEAFQGAIDASSPSKLFADAGMTIPQGVAAGVDEGAPQAQAAVAGMVDVPAYGAGEDGSGGALAAGAGAAGGGVRIEIGQVVVHASSAEPQAMAMDFRRELERVLEGLAAELGGRQPEGAT